jgi:hypothetical protein
MKRILFCFLITLLTLSAAEISGKWSGMVQIKTPDGDNMTVPLFVELQQKGQELSGTIGRSADEKMAIANGKVDGKKLSFQVSTQESANPFKFELALTDAGLEGQMTGQRENAQITGTVTMKRSE